MIDFHKYYLQKPVEIHSASFWNYLRLQIEFLHQIELQNNIQHQMIINVNGRTNINDVDSPTFSEIGIVIDFPTVYDNA